MAHVDDIQAVIGDEGAYGLGSPDGGALDEHVWPPGDGASAALRAPREERLPGFGGDAGVKAAGGGGGVSDDDERFSVHSGNSEGGRDSDDGEETLSLNLPQRQYTKLEAVQARQIDQLLRWHHFVCAIGVAYTLVFIVLANTVWLDVRPPDPEEGFVNGLRWFLVPRGVLWYFQVSVLVLFSLSTLLFLVFTQRIMRLSPRDRTPEQRWVIFLLLSLAMYLNPFQASYKIHDQLLNRFSGAANRWASQDWFDSVSRIFTVVRSVGFTSATVFYVWASAHSYRKLDGKLGFWFYAPKVLVIALYIALKVVIIYAFDCIPAELLLGSFVGMLSLYAAAGWWPLRGMIGAGLLSVFELGLLVWVALQILQTKAVLKKSDYMKYRLQQVGFRFFLYHNLTFYLVFWVLYVMQVTALPQAANVWVYVRFLISNWEAPDVGFGFNLLLLAYVVAEAYVNLPVDALGFKGWFTPQQPRSAAQTDIRPITYRKREPPSFHGVIHDLSGSCFVMQTHVVMFNFSWLVYYWGTPKMENLGAAASVNVVDYITDKQTDTHALIIDGTDRLIVAFKGTTSAQNLKTDLRISHMRASGLLPTRLGGEFAEEDERTRAAPLFQTRQWSKAQIHKGFASAYASIAPRLITKLQSLLQERRRPVFLTGHSLGGALAMICSFDVHTRLGLPASEILVSTFGAPRAANETFRSVYDSQVPTCWRVVVGPDVVAKLPKVGYKHVGKKVLLTRDGELFLDPNSLELNLWSGDAASFLYHRKASYLLAMRAWCTRHHGTGYKPEFMPFPVSADDSRRFDHALTRKKGEVAPAEVAKRTRLLAENAMIEQLTQARPVSAHVLLNWALLTQRLREREDRGEHQDIVADDIVLE